jgi:chromosome segregation ATPase
VSNLEQHHSNCKLEISDISSSTTQISTQYEELINELIALKRRLLKSETRVFELTDQLLEKKSEIKRARKEIDQKDTQIEIDKNSLTEAIDQKDKAIIKLMKDLESKVEQVFEQSNTINDLQAEVSKVRVSDRIALKIREGMRFKGFITEKELEDIIEGIKKPNIIF